MGTRGETVDNRRARNRNNRKNGNESIENDCLTRMNRIHRRSLLNLTEANTDLLQSLANVFRQLAAPNNT